MSTSKHQKLSSIKKCYASWTYVIDLIFDTVVRMRKQSDYDRTYIREEKHKISFK